MKTPPPNTSILGKHGRGSKTSSESGKGRRQGGAAFSQAYGLRTVCPEQVSFSYDCTRQTTNGTTHANRGQSRTGTYNYVLAYIIDGTRTFVQLWRKKQYCTNGSLRPYKSHKKQYRTNLLATIQETVFACNNTDNNQ